MVHDIFYYTTPNSYNRVVLSDPNAKCLDGSQYSYYVSEGTENTKFYINHQGGGWCQDLNECAQRATTALGSSSMYTLLLEQVV